jgi:predicted HTH transcriptional regulator
MIEITDQDLLLRLRSFEDAFVERKTSGDSKDWLKTVVAFANSTPVGYPAVLFIGVKNDGTPEGKLADLDSLQKTLSKQLGPCLPADLLLAPQFERE